MDDRPIIGGITSIATGLSRRRLLRGLAMALGGGGASALLISLGRGGPAARADAPSTTGGLAEAINAYRQANGLPAIPVSPELTKVAQAHVHDLLTYHPDQVPGCNMHSWSNNGPWKGGCFTGAFTDAENHIMWDKPKEIAGYPGYGYENMAFASPAITAAQAVALWTVPGDPHRDVILNQGIWANLQWQALGGWVEDTYASVWFGEQVDPTAAAGAPPAPPSTATAPAAATASGAATAPSTAPATAPTAAPAPPPPSGTSGSSVGTPGAAAAGTCLWGPNQCKQGYVWRVATPTDLVCVTPEVRAQAADDNAHAAERVEPVCAAAGTTPVPTPAACPYGPNQCKQGYVWREAFPGDLVCVTPDVRAQAADDNAHAAERRDPACAGTPAAATPVAVTPTIATPAP